jgi:hypothetical protein
VKLDYNSLLTFRYKAKLEGQLHVYDKTPLVFPLSIYDRFFIGLNIHWITPKTDRVELFNSLIAIIDKTKYIGKQNERIKLTYEYLRKNHYDLGKQGIRMYYYNGMTKLINIPQPRWSGIFSRYGRATYRMRKVYKYTGYKD